MATKAELENQVNGLKLINSQLNKKVGSLQLSIRDFERDSRILYTERDVARKEAGISFSKLARVKESVSTMLALKYPSESCTISEPYYPGTVGQNQSAPTEELNLFRYLISLSK